MSERNASKMRLASILSLPTLLNIVLDSLDEGIVLMDPEYRILAINRAFIQIYGLESSSLSSLLGERCFEVLRGKSVPCDDIPCPVKKVMKSKSMQIIKQIRIINNVTKMIEQLVIPLLDENGNVRQIIKILKDVTSKEPSIIAVLKSYIHAFMNSFLCGCMLVSASGLIEFCNDKCFSIIGRNKNEIVGDDLLNIFPEEVRGHVARLLDDVIREKIMIDFETTLVRNSSGEHVDVVIHMTPIVVDKDVKNVIVTLNPKEGHGESVEFFTKYNIARGRIYLVIEDKPCVGRDVLKDLIDLGFHGIVFTRAPPEDFEDLEVDYYFLCIKPGQKSIPPDPIELKKVILGIKGSRNVILLESLYYLVSNNSFEEVLSFLMEVNEFLSFTKKGVMILSVGPYEVDASKLSLLKKELMELQLTMRPPAYITRDLLEILQFIFNRNRAGELPFQRELCENFNVSKVTMKKKLEILERSGLIRTLKWGRMKVSEVTREGAELLENAGS